MRIRTCVRCNRGFHALVESKNYCSERCRRSAERQRARERSIAPYDEANAKRSDVLVTKDNPSVALLDATAKIYQTGEEWRVSVFSGIVPEWTPPQDVYWTRIETGEWLMMTTIPRPYIEVKPIVPPIDYVPISDEEADRLAMEE